MNAPTLPPLDPAHPDHWDVRVTLRVMHRTPKAFKVAAPFPGPLSACGPTAWLPAAAVTRLAGSASWDGTAPFIMKARVYRRLRAELAPAAAAIIPKTHDLIPV